MISYARLRETLERWPKYPGCARVLRAPLMTAGFPGTFNMSSTEHHWLKEYGGFVGWDHDYVFTTVQSCIRLNDFALLETPRGWTYLGVFEMADLSGEIALAEVRDYRDLYFWQIAELLRFFKDIGISGDRVHASYCTGGHVTDITSGKYRFEFDVPQDNLAREAFLAAGIPEGNLIPDATRDTFLSLHLHRPSPWGYRNEIYVATEREGRRTLVDVATSEYFLWQPLFLGHEKAEGIIGLERAANGALGIGCGVERLCMVVNDLPRVHHVDYLVPFYERLREILGEELRDRDYLAGESLRALHRIQADMDFHPESQIHEDQGGRKWLGTRRRKKAAALRRNIPLSMTLHQLESLLREHSRAQPWHDLHQSVGPTIMAIEKYRNSQARSFIPQR